MGNGEHCHTSMASVFRIVTLTVLWCDKLAPTEPITALLR